MAAMTITVAFACGTLTWVLADAAPIVAANGPLGSSAVVLPVRVPAPATPKPAPSVSAEKLVREAKVYLAKAQYREYFAIVRSLGKRPRAHYLRGLLAEEMGNQMIAEDSYESAVKTGGYGPAQVWLTREKAILEKFNAEFDAESEDDDDEDDEDEDERYNLAKRAADFSLSVEPPECARARKSGFAAYCRCLGVAVVFARRSHWGQRTINELMDGDAVDHLTCKRVGKSPIFAVGRADDTLEYHVIREGKHPGVVRTLTRNESIFSNSRDGSIHSVRRRSFGTRSYLWIEVEHSFGTCPAKPACESNSIRSVVICTDDASKPLQCSDQMIKTHRRDTGLVWEGPDTPQMTRYRFSIQLKADDHVLVRRRYQSAKDPTTRSLGLQRLFWPDPTRNTPKVTN